MSNSKKLLECEMDMREASNKIKKVINLANRLGESLDQLKNIRIEFEIIEKKKKWWQIWK